MFFNLWPLHTNDCWMSLRTKEPARGLYFTSRRRKKIARNTLKEKKKEHKKISTFFSFPSGFSDSLIIVGGSPSRRNYFHQDEKKGDLFYPLSSQKFFFFSEIYPNFFFIPSFFCYLSGLSLCFVITKKNKGIRPRTIPASSSQPTAYQKLVDTRKTKESRQIKSEQFSWFLSFWTGRRPRIKDAAPPTEKGPFSVKFTHTRMNGRFFFLFRSVVVLLSPLLAIKTISIHIQKRRKAGLDDGRLFFFFK